MSGPLPPGDSGRTSDQAASIEPSDEDLMQRFCEGDAQAFDALYARHASGLHGFFRRMTGSGAAADDLSQVTFVHLMKARDRYASGEPLKPWLYAIARNAARDYLRLAHHRESGDAEAERSLASVEADSGPPSDPAELAALQAALDELPPQYREAVVMHQLQGMSFGDIARAVGSTPGAVKVRAHRGYVRLREALARLRSGQ